MIEIKKEEKQIVVRVKLEKRKRPKDPKTYVYPSDALREVKNKFPDLKVSDKPDHNKVASTVREPHEVVWRFKILEQTAEIVDFSAPVEPEPAPVEPEPAPVEPEPAPKQLKNIKKLSKKQQPKGLDELVKLNQEMDGSEKELATDLTSSENSATMEETTEKVQEPTE